MSIYVELGLLKKKLNHEQSRFDSIDTTIDDLDKINENCGKLRRAIRILQQQIQLQN